MIGEWSLAHGLWAIIEGDSMHEYVIGFALLSVAVFILPLVMEWRWMRPLKEGGIDIRSITSPGRWVAYAICGSSAFIVWVVLYLMDLIPASFIGITLVGSMMIAFGILAMLRAIVDVWPACRRMEG